MYTELTKEELLEKVEAVLNVLPPELTAQYRFDDNEVSVCCALASNDDEDEPGCHVSYDSEEEQIKDAMERIFCDYNRINTEAEDMVNFYLANREEIIRVGSWELENFELEDWGELFANNISIKPWVFNKVYDKYGDKISKHLLRSYFPNPKFVNKLRASRNLLRLVEIGVSLHLVDTKSTESMFSHLIKIKEQKLATQEEILDFSPHLESILCALLIDEDGRPDYLMMNRLEKEGIKVYPGEKDSFGWLTGVCNFNGVEIVYG